MYVKMLFKKSQNTFLVCVNVQEGNNCSLGLKNIYMYCTVCSSTIRHFNLQYNVVNIARKLLWWTWFNKMSYMSQKQSLFY